MLTFYDFGTPALGNLGALVRLSSNASSSGSLIIPWDTEVYDVGNWHSTSSDTSRLTVPSGVTLVRVSGNADSGDRGGPDLLRGGSAFRGMGCKSTDTSGQNQTNAASALIEVTAGNYFEFEKSGLTGSVDATVATWFAIEAVDPATKRALVHRSTDQAISAGTTTTITWNAEVYDTDAWHDTGSDPSRLTVPSGVTLVRVGGNLIASNSGQAVISFLKGGGSARGLPIFDTEVSGSERLNAWSAPLEVSPTNYFEMRVFTTAAINVGNDERNWFAIEEVPSTYKRALVYKTGNQSIGNNSTTTLTWDAEVYDTDAIHDNSTANSRLTVPSGVTQARLSFSIAVPSATGQHVGTVLKNGSAGDYGLPGCETDTAGADNLCGMGAWIDVTPGDYFELRYFQNSGGSLNIGTADGTWFCMECR